MRDSQVELLAPAGSPGALLAAVEGGADAVYFGGNLFSCRMRAKNFSEDELREALCLCRDTGVRSYLTLNARLRDGEVEDALKAAANLWEWGADGLIVSDLGFAEAVHREIPEFDLHASTQLSCLSVSDALALRERGFSRMVCPRELSLSEITRLAKESPIGIEMFLHGAHCVSFSGQCMMSYAMGGRSGNRGECAQPCRLPFTVTGHPCPTGDGYPLSLKDLSLAEHITEILASGVVSLKIEGRQKSADYVYGVTRVYRRLLDEKRNAHREEMKELAALFSRQGFTDGYFTKTFRRMGGIRTERDSAASKDASSFTGLRRAVPLSAVFTAQSGERASLTLACGQRSVTVHGDVPEAAVNHPLDEGSAFQALSKFGGTPFTLAKEDFSAFIEGSLWLTKGQLGALRRDALCALRAVERPAVEPSLPKVSLPLWRESQKIGVFRTLSQIPEEASSFFGEIRLPLAEALRAAEKAPALSVVPELPVILTSEEGPAVIKALSALGAKKAVAHTPGQIRLLKELGITPVGSFRLTVMNRLSMATFARDCDSVELSPELPLGAVRSIGGPCAFTVYGRLPLMLTVRCLLSGGGDSCTLGGVGGGLGQEGKTDCHGVLKDRTGAAFPVYSESCRSIVYNSVPIYMADRFATVEALPLREQIFRFTSETKAEAARVIRQHIDHLPPEGPVRRLR